jgi:hypothetical protein
MKKWKIEVNGETIPGIILTGEKNNLMEKMRNLSWVAKIGIPDMYWFEKYCLIPLHYNG